MASWPPRGTAVWLTGSMATLLKPERLNRFGAHCGRAARGRRRRSSHLAGSAAVIRGVTACRPPRRCRLRRCCRCRARRSSGGRFTPRPGLPGRAAVRAAGRSTGGGRGAGFAVRSLHAQKLIMPPRWLPSAPALLTDRDGGGLRSISRQTSRWSGQAPGKPRRAGAPERHGGTPGPPGTQEH
jgi:hypothetical protein